MAARGLNQTDLARRLGRRESSVCRTLRDIRETGKAKAKTAREIAKALGCPLADLMPEGHE